MNTFVRLAIVAIAVLGMTQKVSAQAATQTINLSADVIDYCSINGASAGVTLSDTLTTSNGVVDTTPLPTFTISNVVCSTATDVTISSLNGGVLSATPAPAGFQNVIHYQASATFDGATATITPPTTTATAATAGAGSGNLTVTVTPQANALPLVVASNYADVITVTLAPQ